MRDVWWPQITIRTWRWSVRAVILFESTATKKRKKTHLNGLKYFMSARWISGTNSCCCLENFNSIWQIILFIVSFKKLSTFLLQHTICNNLHHFALYLRLSPLEEVSWDQCQHQSLRCRRSKIHLWLSFHLSLTFWIDRHFCPALWSHHLIFVVSKAFE